MCQLKVRAESVQHTRDLVVNHSGYEEICLLPKKYSQFHRLNLQYIFPFIDCLLLLFNVFYHRSDREIPTTAAFAGVHNMSSSGHMDK